MGLAPGGSERASPRASPAHSARSAPAGTFAGLSAAGGAEREPERRCSSCVRRIRAAQGTGPQRPDWTETVLSALRRPRLSRPQLEKQRRPRTFLRSQGRTTAVLQSMPAVAPGGAMELGLPEA